MTPLWSIIIVILSTILGSIGALYFKFASEHLHLKQPKSFFRREIYIALSMFGLGTVLFIVALNHGELSILYPMTSIQYIWVTLWSMKFLKEKMNMFKLMGITIIIIGVILVGLAS
jgi:uncharacterized membrane protein